MTRQKFPTNKRTTQKRKILIISAVAAVVIIGGGAITWQVRRNSSSPKTSTPTAKTQTIENRPATPEEKAESNANKDAIIKNTTGTNTNTGTGTTAVEPVITNATPSSVNAYVPKIFEEGGTCTATFTNGGQTLTKSSSGFQNVSVTQCTPMTLESGFLSSGSWSVAVSYASPTAAGKSASATIEVP